MLPKAVVLQKGTDTEFAGKPRVDTDSSLPARRDARPALARIVCVSVSSQMPGIARKP
ncbi:hypothetical protein [Bradyrhizobium sp.]|uniref:hypothetical protein n=1 Tax=Bradyrhizobium sp. TaxID=376 RepID=UPI0026216F84|nr:hypothetical protein [Bradyrhizobium sp.]